MAQVAPSKVGVRALSKLEPWLGRGFEDGRNNRGRFPDLVQSVDDLPGAGYSWCASTVTWAVEQALRRDFREVRGQASVWSWLSAARASGWIVRRPRRGDLVCYRFRSLDCVDHIGIVDRVLRLGPVLRIRTIEGNTGPSGAVSDPGSGRDGLYKKVRYVRRPDVEFIRLPDYLMDDSWVLEHVLRERNGIPYTEPKGTL